MGVNAVLWVRFHSAEETELRASELGRALASAATDSNNVPSVHSSRIDGKPWVHVRTGYRYADEMRSGPWPWILQGIRAIQVAAPDADVWYGADASNRPERLVDDAFLAEQWAAWADSGEDELCASPTCDRSNWRLIWETLPTVTRPGLPDWQRHVLTLECAQHRGLLEHRFAKPADYERARALQVTDDDVRAAVDLLGDGWHRHRMLVDLLAAVRAA